MTALYNRRRLAQIRSALAFALEEIRQGSNIRQDIACKQRQILESAELELIVGNHGSKITDDLPTRYLFADPRRMSSEDRGAIIDIARFLMKRPEWRMVSALSVVPAERVLAELRSAGIFPSLAFEVFLSYYQTEASDSGMQASAA